MLSLDNLHYDHLAEIEGYLETPDLCALSLTARHFRFQAQDNSVRNARITRDGDPRGSSRNNILRFLRTLLGFPKLIPLVKSLDITVGTGEVDISLLKITYKPGDPKPLPDVATALADIQVTLEEQDPFVTMTEPQVAAMLLGILVNLKELSLTCVRGQSTDALTMSYVFSDLLFKDREQGTSLGSVAGYNKLQRLEMPIHQFHPDFVGLPSLRHVTLVDTMDDDWNNYDELEIEWPLNEIASLDLTVGSHIILTGISIAGTTRAYRRLKSFLASFSKLNTLKIGFHPEHNGGRDLRNSSYPLLIRSMAAYFDSLEVLDLSSAWLPGRSRTPDLEPVRSLTEFTRLRVLRIPQYALLPGELAEDDMDTGHVPLDRLFPPSLKTLDIRYTDVGTMRWFGEVIREKDSLPNWNKLYIDIDATGPGRVVPTLNKRISQMKSIYGGIRTEIEAARMVVKITCNGVDLTETFNKKRQ